MVEDVKSYECYINFKGSESFKVFHRRRTGDASSMMIPINASILVIAKPENIFKTEAEKEAWLLEALFARSLE